MMQLLELLPVAIFALVYFCKGSTVAGITFDGIYTATAALMIATCLQVLIIWLARRQVEKRVLWLLVGVLAFGGATLLFHNQLFIQWKPTIFNWILAVILIGAQLGTGKNIVQRILGDELSVPEAVCLKLNSIWAGYFFVVGLLNLVVAYNFTETFWVTYKLASSIGFTLLMTFITALIVAPYIKDETAADKSATDTGRT